MLNNVHAYEKRREVGCIPLSLRDLGLRAFQVKRVVLGRHLVP